MSDRGTPWPALLELTIVRVKEFVREPEALFWVFAFPVLMACALGLAFRNRPPDPVVVGIEGRADGPLAALTSAEGVRLDLLPLGDGEAALRTGRVQLLVRYDGASPTYLYDPARAESRTARLVVDDVLQRAAGRRDVWTGSDRHLVARGSRYIDWLVPGLLGMNIMSTGMWSVGFAVVQARTRKLLKRLVATPMRRRDYLLSHLFGRLLFLVGEVAALLLFAKLIFDVPVYGSWVLVGALCLIGALAFGGLGLLVASRPRTVEGVSGLLNVTMLPMWLLSGVFFSASNFPEGLQPFIRALPLTALNDALRLVMLEAADLRGILVPLLVLTAWGVVGFAVALPIFRWK